MPTSICTFDAGSSQLTPKAKEDLDGVYAWMKKHPTYIVLLAGYDDQRTPEKESVVLGWKRAGAVKDYLVSLGADPDRVSAISFGNTRVAFSGSGEEVWAKNRRVRYRVVAPPNAEKMEGMPSGVCQRCKR